MKSFKVLIVSILLIYLFPFVLTIMNKDDFQFNILKQVNNKITSKCKTELEKANALFLFTCNSIKTPIYNTYTKSNNGYHLMLSDSLWCDEQCVLLTSLTEFSSIKGRLIFLKGTNQTSKHTVCELFVNNKFYMFDPFYQLKSTMNVEEISTTKNLKKNNLDQKLYTGKFPHTYGNLKITSYRIKEKIIHSIFTFWLETFGDLALKPYLKLAYRVNQISIKEQIKINHWLFQSAF